MYCRSASSVGGASDAPVDQVAEEPLEDLAVAVVNEVVVDEAGNELSPEDLADLKEKVSGSQIPRHTDWTGQVACRVLFGPWKGWPFSLLPTLAP